jgi:hypothetical protein
MVFVMPEFYGSDAGRALPNVHNGFGEKHWTRAVALRHSAATFSSRKKKWKH